jgi:hypothetical protein
MGNRSRDQASRWNQIGAQKMVEIRHLKTGKVLHTVDSESLAGVNLVGLDLREANLVDVDLTAANLREAKLGGADLSRANLKDSCLIFAHLEFARLVDANLMSANIFGAALDGTDIYRASFHSASLESASLCRANLPGTYLYRTILRGADLRHANLAKATFGNTDLTACPTIGEARGLDEALHEAHSFLDARTLRAAVPHLPDLFLQGVGYTNEEIQILRSLYTQAIQYYSCFISHYGDGEDSEFSDRLRADLINNNVSCWHFRYDMRAGQFWRTQIAEAIKLHDKLVLVCSEQALVRRNVVDEIIAAIERERERGSQKLFPIRLDDFILGDEMLEIADAKMKAGEWREDWVRYVRAYHIPDFRRWKDHDVYRTEFQKLLRDLKHPAPRPK